MFLNSSSFTLTVVDCSCCFPLLFNKKHFISSSQTKQSKLPQTGDSSFSPGLNHDLFQEEFDNDVDALLEEGMPVPKKMRPAEDKYGGDSDHQSDAEEGVQPMMTKIKTVLKSECRLCLLRLRFKRCRVVILAACCTVRVST